MPPVAVMPISVTKFKGSLTRPGLRSSAGDGEVAAAERGPDSGQLEGSVTVVESLNSTS